MSRKPQDPSEDEAADPVWGLLDRAEKPEPAPFFAARVMRRIEALPQARRVAWWHRLFRSPATPALAGAAALLLMFIGLHPSGERTHRSLGSPTPAPLLADGDLDVIADLDQLIAYEESATWLESPAY